MSADDLVQRAADLYHDWMRRDGRSGKRGIAKAFARFLVERGWHDGPKLSDADRAVLDAAEHQERVLHRRADQGWECDCPTCAAVRTRRETQLPPTPTTGGFVDWDAHNARREQP